MKLTKIVQRTETEETLESNGSVLWRKEIKTIEDGVQKFRAVYWKKEEKSKWSGYLKTLNKKERTEAEDNYRLSFGK